MVTPKISKKKSAKPPTTKPLALKKKASQVSNVSKSTTKGSVKGKDNES